MLAGTIHAFRRRLGRLVWSLAIVALVPVAAHGQTCEDRDGDGYFAVDGCGTPRDCNDDDASIHPGASEVCDGRDGDCNGVVDDSPACDRSCESPEKYPFETQVSQDPLAASDWGDLVWIGDSWVVAYQTWWNGSCARLSLQRLNESGERIGDPVVVSDGYVWADKGHLLWTGTTLLVTWSEIPYDPTCFGAVGTFRPYVQRYDANLQALGARIELDCLPYNHAGEPRAAWSGAVFGVVWGREGVLFYSTMSRDGVVADRCGIIVSGNNQAGGIYGLRWSGGVFGIAWSECRPGVNCGVDESFEIYFRRLGEDLNLPDPAPVRLTFDPEMSDFPRLAWADGEWGISWYDDRDAPASNLGEIYFMRLDPDGTKIDPPGDIRVTCCNSDAGGTDHGFNDLAWTGEEFGLVYGENTHPTDITGELRFRRLDAIGNPLETSLLLTPDTNRNALHTSLAWNGTEYGLVWDDVRAGMGARQVLFARIACDCHDADGDGYTTCVGGDCDDGNPSVRPGVTEECLNGIDDNCDATIDCQDVAACPAASGPIPGEVLGLTVASDKQSLTWQPESRSDVYDLMTGEIAALRVDVGFASARCLAWRVTQTSYLDTTTPSPGDGNYYLVRGKKDRCKLGTWGTSLRDQAKLACP